MHYVAVTIYVKVPCNALAVQLLVLCSKLLLTVHLFQNRSSHYCFMKFFRNDYIPWTASLPKNIRYQLLSK